MNFRVGLGLAAVWFAVFPVRAAWTPVEDFEGGSAGASAPFSHSFDGTGVRRSMEAGFDGLAGQIDNSNGTLGGHVYEYDFHPVMADSGLGKTTFFFQAQWDEIGADTLFSLSYDGGQGYPDLNIIFRVPGDSTLEVYDGERGYQDTSMSVEIGTVYNFWVVINRAAGTWELFSSTGKDAGSSVAAGGATVFGFRNKAGSVMDTFYLGANGSSRYRIDNLFVDLTGANTTIAGEFRVYVPLPVNGVARHGETLPAPPSADSGIGDGVVGMTGLMSGLLIFLRRFLRA